MIFLIGGPQGSTSGGDAENVMDSLLLDIRYGFPMRDKVIISNLKLLSDRTMIERLFPVVA